MARPVVTYANLAARNPPAATYREIFIAQDLSMRPGNDPSASMSLADALGAWQGVRASLLYANTTEGADQTADALAFEQAAAEELAYAARELAAHHDDTLICQLGFSAVQVTQIRGWAAGTVEGLDGAVVTAYAASRPITRASLTGAPMVASLPAMVARGVPCGDPIGG